MSGFFQKLDLEADHLPRAGHIPQKPPKFFSDLSELFSIQNNEKKLFYNFLFHIFSHQAIAIQSTMSVARLTRKGQYILDYRRSINTGHTSQ